MAFWNRPLSFIAATRRLHLGLDKGVALILHAMHCPTNSIITILRSLTESGLLAWHGSPLGLFSLSPDSKQINFYNDP